MPETHTRSLQSLSTALDEIEVIIASTATWDRKFSLVFQLYRATVVPLLEALGMTFEYFDPDTTCEEDVMALVRALRELRVSLGNLLPPDASTT